MKIAITNKIAGITEISHNIPCSANGVCTAKSALNPTKDRTYPGIAPPKATPALKNIPVTAFAIPATLLPVLYSSNATTSGTNDHINPITIVVIPVLLTN